MQNPQKSPSKWWLFVTHFRRIYMQSKFVQGQMKVVQWVYYMALNTTNSFSLPLHNKSSNYWPHCISISLLKLLIFIFHLRRKIGTNGNFLLVNFSWLTYHNLDSRPWASRHKRGRSGWKGCTGQTKRHKRRRQCRSSDETATWKKRGRDLFQVYLGWKMCPSSLTFWHWAKISQYNPLRAISTISPPSKQETVIHFFLFPRDTYNCGEQPCT